MNTGLLHDLFEEKSDALIGRWKDPNPIPILEEHEGIIVVRDDLLVGGTKRRAGDYLISSHHHVEEWVYGSSPAHGYAQIALQMICKQYGKKAVLFMAKRSKTNLTKQQKIAIAEGADIRFVANGMLSVTEKRARDYVAEDPMRRKLLPIGVDHPTAVACVARVAQGLPITPTEVWSVGSSGTLIRGLQAAWPSANFHCVLVGHKGNYGLAKTYQSPLKFSQEVPWADLPPFPSVPSYDAKAWKFVMQYASKGALFWNVGS